MAQLDKFKKLGVEYPVMRSSPVASSPISGDTSVDDGLGMSEPELASFLHADVKMQNNWTSTRPT